MRIMKNYVHGFFKNLLWKLKDIREGGIVNSSVPITQLQLLLTLCPSWVHGLKIIFWRNISADAFISFSWISVLAHGWAGPCWTLELEGIFQVQPSEKGWVLCAQSQMTGKLAGFWAPPGSSPLVLWSPHMLWKLPCVAEAWQRLTNAGGPKPPVLLARKSSLCRLIGSSTSKIYFLRLASWKSALFWTFSRLSIILNFLRVGATFEPSPSSAGLLSAPKCRFKVVIIGNSHWAAQFFHTKALVTEANQSVSKGRFLGCKLESPVSG